MGGGQHTLQVPCSSIFGFLATCLQVRVTRTSREAEKWEQAEHKRVKSYVEQPLLFYHGRNVRLERKGIGMACGYYEGGAQELWVGDPWSTPAPNNGSEAGSLTWPMFCAEAHTRC